MERNLYKDINTKLDEKLQTYFSQNEINKYLKGKENIIKCKYILLLKMKRKIDFILNPRNVHVCGEISENLNLTERASIEKIINYIENGDNKIINYMSKTINKPEFHDNMLNNDCIYHFHLGKNGNRSNNRLFIYFTPNDAYLIDCYKHFAEMEQILERYQKLYKYYPELFEAKIGNSNLTNTEIKNIRSKNGVILDYPLSEKEIGHLKFRGATSGSGDYFYDIMKADELEEILKYRNTYINVLSEKTYNNLLSEIITNFLLF